MTTMADITTSRAHYLQEAAHLLAISSPAASAFLGTARARFIEDVESEVPAKEWDALRRETCGACGSLLIPGWSCEISTKSLPLKSGLSRKGKPNDLAISNPSTVYNCLRCHRTTEQKLQPRPRKHLKKSKAVVIPQPSMVTKTTMKEEDVKAVKTANASSKQRQKARKGGLQAMLEKNKTKSASQGLDLMDFAM
jgi:RNase P subunit RPR2